MRSKKVSKKSKETINIDKYKKEFISHMDDDLNTPSALATIFALMRKTNALIANNTLTITTAKNILTLLKTAESILGVPFIKTEKTSIPNAVMQLALKREKYRKTKNWGEADKIRDEIKKKGYEIKDLGDEFEIIPN